VWNKNLKTSSNKWNYPFSEQYLQTQANKIFQSLKNLKENDNISFSEYLKFLNLDESTYILSLKNKLTKPHINEPLKT